MKALTVSEAWLLQAAVEAGPNGHLLGASTAGHRTRGRRLVALGLLREEPAGRRSRRLFAVEPNASAVLEGFALSRVSG